MICEICGGEAKEIARHDIHNANEMPIISDLLLTSRAAQEVKYECENCHKRFYVWEAINENA